MSLRVSNLQSRSYCFPVGNTPAVCLTQNLPPDTDAKLLLLGCGDVRNALFTVYAGSGIGPQSPTYACDEAMLTAPLGDRKLDFTCCDSEAEIIARNILILSLILSDTDGSRSSIIWNVYYHIVLDDESLLQLQQQAKMLVGLASSLEQWNSSPVGSVVRFGDSITLQKVVRLWKLYEIDSSQAKEYKNQQKKLELKWKNAQEYRRTWLGNSDKLVDNLRAFLPDFSPTIMADAQKQYDIFWHSGTTFQGKDKQRKHTLFNPMFAWLRDGAVLHPGTNPLSTFHLASVYIKVSSESLLPNNASMIDSAKGKSIPCPLCIYHIRKNMLICSPIFGLESNLPGSTTAYYHSLRQLRCNSLLLCSKASASSRGD